MGDNGKLYVSADDFLLDSFRLARLVLDSGWMPDTMLALWRGGAPVGVAVHEFMAFHGLEMRQIVARSSSYSGIWQRGSVRLELSAQELAALGPGRKVLVVDDVFDSGATAAAVMRRLEETGAEARIATVYWKPKRNTTAMAPHYHVRATDAWIVFPHELLGLDAAEIAAKSGALGAIIKSPARAAAASPAARP